MLYYRNNMKIRNYILLLASALTLGSCSEDAIEKYDSGRYLYFTPQVGDIDSLVVSFRHYVGKEELTLGFELNLIGELPATDLDYDIEIIDSLTTALPETYTVERNQTFHKGMVKDSMFITLHKTPALSSNVVVAFSIVPNSNFEGGMPGQRHVRVFCNDLLSKPLWWDEEIDAVYLGEYSDEKYTEFITCTGISDLSKYSASWKRVYALEFKQYVEDNNLDMEIPIF